MEYTYFIAVFIILYYLRKYLNGPISNLRKNMNDKIVIITGASAGLGKESALQLLEDGATVIFACRDEHKTKRVLETIPLLNQTKALFMKLDLTSYESVLSFVNEFKQRFNKLDILVNNAGCFPEVFSLTMNNTDYVLQSNHLSHMLLTYLLLDYFDRREGKIINISSMVHSYADLSLEKIDGYYKDESFEIFKNDYYKSIMSREALYANTKLANIYFTQYLAEYLDKQYSYIKTASVHPGVVNTEFFSKLASRRSYLNLFFYLIYPFIYYMLKTPNIGAQTQLHLCYMDNKEMINGAYYQDCKIGSLTTLAKNVQVRNSFMKYSKYMIKNYYAVDD